MVTNRVKRKMAQAGALIALAFGAVLQACVLSSDAPLVDTADALRLLPDSFIATEMESAHQNNRLDGESLVYTGRYMDGKYALIRQSDEAAVDVTFAEIGGGDLLMMMEWHIDEDTPFMYLTGRYETPYLIFDDPEYLADNIDDYRRQFGDDIELIRDGSKFNDSLKIATVEAAANAIRFYRGRGEVIRYRIDPLP